MVPDNEMPYLTQSTYTDEYGVVHPEGPIERVDVLQNPLSIYNRSIPLALIEPSITFILDKTRKHAATLPFEEARDFIFDIIRMLNPYEAKELKHLYDPLAERKKKEFIDNCISLDENELLITSKGIYIRWEAFDATHLLRDAICEIYDKYGDVILPYHIFTPKPNWGRDIYIGTGHVGYMYMYKLKQNGDSGFSVRSAGAISDESLPEKSNDNKTGKSWHSVIIASLLIIAGTSC